MRKYVSSLALVAALLVPAVSSAQSLAELQTQIQALLLQVSALEAQLGIQGATPTPAYMPPLSSYVTASGCVVLAGAMSFGSSGTAVSALQNFLISQGNLAPGNATGYFGALTRSALQNFQAKHGLVSSGTETTTGYGATGPRTRALVQSLSCGSGGSPTPTPSPIGPSSIPCILGTTGIPVASGGTVTLYDSPTVSGGPCRAQIRQCVNGFLNGDPQFQFNSCVAIDLPTETCRLDSVTVPDGGSRIFYSVRSVDFGESCSEVGRERTCEDGDFDGPSRFKYRSCEVDTPTCTLDGITLNQGSSTTFYFAENIPANEKCSSYAQTRSCTSNDKLSGNAVYKYSSCAPVATGRCALDNVTLDSGASASFYKYRTTPAGELCSAHVQTRTCNNGSLSGSSSFLYGSCSNNTKCTLDGTTVEHGSSGVFYKERTVAFGTTCASTALTRTCTNAKFSGSDDYKYNSCSVNPPSAATTQYLASALAAIESALQAILGKLAE